MLKTKVGMASSLADGQPNQTQLHPPLTVPGRFSSLPRMAKKFSGAKGRAGTPLPAAGSQRDDGAHGVTSPTSKLKPSASLDTRVVYRGDNLEQLRKLPDDVRNFSIGSESNRPRPENPNMKNAIKSTECGIPAVRWQVEGLLQRSNGECRQALEQALVCLTRAEVIHSMPEIPCSASSYKALKKWGTTRESALRCAQFLLLIECGWSGNCAARHLGRSASWFSVNVPRYTKDGWRAFLPKYRGQRRVE